MRSAASGLLNDHPEKSATAIRPDHRRMVRDHPQLIIPAETHGKDYQNQTNTPRTRTVSRDLYENCRIHPETAEDPLGRSEGSESDRARDLGVRLPNGMHGLNHSHGLGFVPE
jgi:hypothetical protein